MDTRSQLGDRTMLAVGVTLDQKHAEQVLEVALALAVGTEGLPAEWLDRSEKVSAAQSKSFTPMLGTALLAKATNDRVSALALKEGAAHNAYSARGLAHNVLVPFASRNGINLRTTGAEPLNNQPFFRYEVVSREMKVRQAGQLDLDYLVDCLEQADFLRDDQALLALAAFLRVRIADPATVLVDLHLDHAPNLSLLARATNAFVTADPEGGRRGQALGAAALDLVYEDVRTARVNNPSRGRAGDVIIMESPTVVFCSVEVKQKPISMVEIMQFAGRLSQDSIRRGLILALHPGQSSFDGLHLLERAWSEHGVLLDVVIGTDAVLSRALLQSPQPITVALQAFPSRMLRRLHEMECGPPTLEQWRSIIRDLVP